MHLNETLELESEELVLRFSAAPGGAENIQAFIDMIDELGPKYGIYRARYKTDEFGLKKITKTVNVITSV